MNIEIWSDVVCPWCYIGKRRFEMALRNFAHRESVRVIWRSFELDANAPRRYQGSLDELLARKFGINPQKAAAMNERVALTAREVGLDFRLADARPGNTFDAHRLMKFAAERELGERATERIMHAYFCEGLAVGDHHALARLAPEFGIAETEALAMLESGDFGEAVRADEARAAETGIRGVPFFLLNGRAGIAGAQQVEIFSQELQQAWDGFSLHYPS